MYLISSWYTHKELSPRTALFYSSFILATAFLGLIAAGIFAGLDGARGIAGWKWLFIIEFAATFLVGLIVFVVLPDFPGSKTGSAGTWLLTEEQIVAVTRMQRDRVSGSEEGKLVWYGLKLACKDWRTWVFLSC